MTNNHDGLGGLRFVSGVVKLAVIVGIVLLVVSLVYAYTIQGSTFDKVCLNNIAHQHCTDEGLNYLGIPYLWVIYRCSEYKNSIKNEVFYFTADELRECRYGT